MSRVNPSEWEERELTFTCRGCGQPPGAWCVTRGGHWSGYLHSDRHQQAYAERERERREFHADTGL